MTPSPSFRTQPSTPPAGRPLLWHLALLGLTLTLPVLLFAAVVAASLVKAERQRLTAELLASARQTAAVLDLKLAGYAAAVQALATSNAATDGDFRALRQQGERIGRELGLHFVLRDARGETTFDTRLPEGAAGGGAALAAAVEVSETGQPRVSDLVADPLGLRPAVLVTAPIVHAGAVSHFLSAVVAPATLREPLLNPATAPEGSTLVDGTGTIIARWRHHEEFVGKAMPAQAKRALVGDEGFMEGSNLEGERNVVAYARLQGAHWYVGAGMLAETLEAPLRRSLAMLASLALGLVALAAAGSWWVARRLAGPIGALAQSAERVGRGDSVATPATPVREVNLVGRALADASARLQAHERELRTSNDRFRALAEGMPHFVWETGADGEATYENARWREYTGLDHDRTGHGGWLTVQHPDDASRMAQAWAQAVATGGEYDTLCRFRHAADGAYRWFRVKGAPIRDDEGHVIRWVGTCTDVHEQRVAEEALRRSEALLAATFSGIEAAVTVSEVVAGGECFRFLNANRAAVEWSGVPLERWVGSRPEDVFPAADAAAVTARYREALAQGRSIAYEERITLPSRTMWALTTVSTLRDTGGTPDRLVATSLDITERKHAEEALHEADRRKDEFLAMLGHELRNPLAPIVNAVRILATPGADPVTQEHARTMIERQVTHMARLIDDLLDVNRITRGKLELRREPVALAPLVAEAAEAVRAQCEAAGLRLEVDLPREPVTLDADRVRLAQVLGNLLTNACRYTEPGGVVRIAAAVCDGWAEIRVADTGVGIPADRLLHVFEPFTQLDRSHGRTHGGLGLGLALVERLVAMHGGAVAATSAGPGRGSEFVVRLPVASGAPPVSPATPEATPPAASRRVLVVDDNRDNADSLTMLLTLDGHDARTAYDGATALATAGALRPDVILLDLGMPDLDGFEVCRRIRAEPWGRAVAVIALSGWGQESDRRKAREAGFDGHLVKPVAYDALAQAMASALRGAAAG